MRYDFTPLYRSTIGFDRLLDTFGRQLDADAAPGWPPYDIERVSELEFGRFMRRGRGRFPCAAKYGVEFLHGPGLAGT
jgi:hypothetical protein